MAETYAPNFCSHLVQKNTHTKTEKTHRETNTERETRHRERETHRQNKKDRTRPQIHFRICTTSFTTLT